MIKRKLVLVSALNMSTFVCFVFAMSFYQWAYVQLDVNESSLDSKKHIYWVNLLYVRQNIPGSPYQSFVAAEKKTCINNIYCSALFFELHFVGYLCFSIFSIAVSMQLLEFGKMIYYALTIGKIVHARKNFRHIVSISTYSIGLTLNAFSFQIMESTE